MRTQGGRGCSRASCRSQATMTLTYVYSESTAVVGPLATYSEPHAYDLCAVHGARLKVPHGWNVIKQELDGQTQGPTEDDLMAIADAVREVALKEIQPDSPNAISSIQQHIGRRGHLRAVPSSE
jgi:hypothetical protein